MKKNIIAITLFSLALASPLSAFSQQMTLKEYVAQAEQGSPYAAFRTGLAYEYGVGGIQKDTAKAIYYYKIADKNGNLKGTAKLGALYFTQGYTKDALPYLTKAVKQGDPLAQAYLGKLLENNKQTDNAVKLYELSSRAKNPIGQMFYSDYLIKNFYKNKNSDNFLKGYALLALSAQKNDDAKNKLLKSKEVFSSEQKQIMAKWVNEYK